MYDQPFRDALYENMLKEKTVASHRIHFDSLCSLETKQSFPITHRQRKGVKEDGLDEWILFCLVNYLHAAVQSREQVEIDEAIRFAEKTKSQWGRVLEGSILELRRDYAAMLVELLSLHRSTDRPTQTLANEAKWVQFEERLILNMSNVFRNRVSNKEFPSPYTHMPKMRDSLQSIVPLCKPKHNNKNEAMIEWIKWCWDCRAPLPLSWASNVLLFEQRSGREWSLDFDYTINMLPPLTAYANIMQMRVDLATSLSSYLFQEAATKGDLSEKASYLLVSHHLRMCVSAYTGEVYEGTERLKVLNDAVSSMVTRGQNFVDVFGEVAASSATAAAAAAAQPSRMS